MKKLTILILILLTISINAQKIIYPDDKYSVDVMDISPDSKKLIIVKYGRWLSEMIYQVVYANKNEVIRTLDVGNTSYSVTIRWLSDENLMVYRYEDSLFYKFNVFTGEKEEIIPLRGLHPINTVVDVVNKRLLLIETANSENLYRILIYDLENETFHKYIAKFDWLFNVAFFRGDTILVNTGNLEVFDLKHKKNRVIYDNQGSRIWIGDANITISKDKKYILFSAQHYENEEEKWRIYCLNWDTKEVTRLDFLGEDYAFPILSPDNSYFCVLKVTSQPSQSYIVYKTDFLRK